MTEENVFIPVALASDVALECDVQPSNPPPQIKWRRDGSLIVETGRENNLVRFLDGGRYLYMRMLSQTDLASTYRCEVTNALLDRTVPAPTAYQLFNNLTQGVLKDYKEIGNLTAFVGNTSFEFAYVGGVFGEGTRALNDTTNILFHGTIMIPNVGNIATIDTINTVGIFELRAHVRYDIGNTDRFGMLTVYRKLFIGVCFLYSSVVIGTGTGVLQAPPQAADW